MEAIRKAPRALAWAVILISGTTLNGATALAQDKVTLNWNVFGPKRAVTASIEAMADLFQEKSSGRVEINIAYGAALGPEKQTPEAIKTGGYEGGQMCAGYYPNKFPLLAGLELPFLMPRELEKRVKVEEAVFAHPEIVKEMEQRWNIKYFAPTFLPAYEFMGNKRIETVDDLKGVKMRISGLNAIALQKFGAVPTVVTAPESYTALERGTIDSFGFPYAYSFGAYRLHEVSKYVTEGMGLSGFMCWQGISTTAWSKLPDNVKGLLKEGQEKGTKALLQAYKEADAKWIPIFKEKLEVVPFAPEQRAKLEAGATEIWEKWAADQEKAGRPGRAFLEFVKAEVAKHK